MNVPFPFHLPPAVTLALLVVEVVAVEGRPSLVPASGEGAAVVEEVVRTWRALAATTR